MKITINIIIIIIYISLDVSKFKNSTGYQITISPTANNLCNTLDFQLLLCHIFDYAEFYTRFSSEVQTLKFLQSAFDVVESHLTRLELILNTGKSKLMMFLNNKKLLSSKSS